MWELNTANLYREGDKHFDVKQLVYKGQVTSGSILIVHLNTTHFSRISDTEVSQNTGKNNYETYI